jgi:hypothetical protein
MAIRNRSRTHAQLSLHPKWQVCVRRRRYRGDTVVLTPSNQAGFAYFKLLPKYSRGFHLIQHRVEAETAFSSTEPWFDQRGYRNYSGQVPELQNGEETRWRFTQTRIG